MKAVISISLLFSPFLALSFRTELQDVRRYCTNKTPFDYEKFLQAKIQERKESETYHIYQVVNRDVSRFPEADEFSPTQNNGKRRIIVWCTNDVLGMSHHPKVKQAVHDAIEKFGVGSVGSRLVGGTSLLHVTLERELADFHGKEAAFISSSGFLSNSSSLQILGKILPGCEFYSAAGNHASLIQGITSSPASKFLFRSGDACHLNELLSRSECGRPKLVVFESVYSIIGLKSDVEELCAVARHHGALTFVDEVHSVGLYGNSGGGIGELQGVGDKIDILAGSLAKALGTSGVYLTGTSTMVDAVRNYAPGYIFTTSVSPMTLAGSLASLHILRSEEGVQLRQKHQHNVNFLKNLLVTAGLPVERNDSHIIPVIVGNPHLCTKVALELINSKGHYVTDVKYPIVPKGQELLRFMPTPFHTEEMMTTLVNDLAEIWQQVVIPHQ